jgi:hypothetical protein
MRNPAFSFYFTFFKVNFDDYCHREIMKFWYRQAGSSPSTAKHIGINKKVNKKTKIAFSKFQIQI